MGAVCRRRITLKVPDRWLCWNFEVEVRFVVPPKLYTGCLPVQYSDVLGFIYGSSIGLITGSTGSQRGCTYRYLYFPYSPWDCKALFISVVGPAAPAAKDPASELKECSGVWTGDVLVHVTSGPRPTV